jgi:hypothetical protein
MENMIKELDRVALVVDLPEHRLKAGDVGTVVDIAGAGEQYTLEFLTLDGDTFAVVPVHRTQVRSLKSKEVTLARAVEAAAA